MGEFFKGWRCKAGLATLAMACVLFVGWMRSLVLIDFYEFSVRDREHAFGSFHGYLTWRSWDRDSGTGGTWQTLPADKHSAETWLDLKSEFVVNSRTRQWVIRHASLVLPLTLLSAWLILGKRQEANPSPTQS
ncbi:MAG: hypothetical protein IAG10_26385 [Planctomycetaceae bacterium]|nr:hypothetical protein [Planctomycetaceae bacterium]